MYDKLYLWYRTSSVAVDYKDWDGFIRYSSILLVENIARIVSSVFEDE